MIVDFTATFIEEIVGVAEATGRLDRAGFHAERERLYSRPVHEREDAFRDLSSRWFQSLPGGALLLELFNSRPRIAKDVARSVVGLASRARDEGVELLVAPEHVANKPSERRRLRIQLLPETFLDPKRLSRLLASELLHIDDMLDPEFLYEPRLPSAQGGPTQDRLRLERYGALWAASALGRLIAADQIEPDVARQFALRRLTEAFPMHAGSIETVFADLLKGERPTHPELAALAEDPGLRGGTHVGARCALCGFTTYDFEPAQAIDEMVRARILVDAPEWVPEGPVCRQCADLYRAKVALGAEVEGQAVSRARLALGGVVLLCASLASSSANAELFEGRVLDGTGQPIADGIVRVNRGPSTRTSTSGYFALDATRDVDFDMVNAAVEGQFNEQILLSPPMATTGLEIVMRALPGPDPTFEPDAPFFCNHCHFNYSGGWSLPARGGYNQSAHAQSAVNPRVLDIYRGTASGRTDPAKCAEVGGSLETITGALGGPEVRCYVGAGLLPDENPGCGHPGQGRCDDHASPDRAIAFSDCAGCHTPGAAIRIPAELDMDVAEASPAASSVTCAACHRIKEVLDPNAAGVVVGARVVQGTDGLLAIGLGPLDDATGDGMGASWSPLFESSLMCAPCHQDTYRAPGIVARWTEGVPSEQTYAEWLESPYATGPSARTCQSCHMPSLADLGVDPVPPIIGNGGLERPASVMHVHDFKPLTDSATRAITLGLDLTARVDVGTLLVEVALENKTVGHGFPSGVTSRNALLVVSAEIDGQRLVEIGGEVLPPYAGQLANGSVVGTAGDRIILDQAHPQTILGKELRIFRVTSTPRPHQSFGILRPLSDAQKGLHRTDAVGRFLITGLDGAEVEIDRRGAPLLDLTGALYAIGDEDRLAGVSGLGLAKVNVAADGTPDVPFWMATDILWDNRLAPHETQRAEHRFHLPPGTRGTVTARARLLYRKSFVDLAIQRGWTGNEQLAKETSRDVVVDVPAPPDAGTLDASATDVGSSDVGSDEADEGCSCTATESAPSLAILGWLALAVFARRRRS